MKKYNGFTLIELLIVIAIVGIIGTLAAIAVNAARSKQRDATRLANVRQIQIVLEEHFNDQNKYPDGNQLPLGDASQSACLSESGFQADCSAETTVYLQPLPATLNKGLDNLATCGTPARNAFCYTHFPELAAYAISFELENPVPQAGLVEGVNCATPNDIRAGTCPTREQVEGEQNEQ